MAEIAPETIVDERYRVVNRIGSGGMADVFCAHDNQLGRKVALKLLHRRFARDEDFVERFRREASSAAGLQHPNVVGVYDRGEWDGTYYIAMEHLEGRNLKEVVRQEAPLDPLRAIDLTIQILKAARFAHKRGIVHRDLKPHNVIVDGEGRAKVTDFGIARAGASDMTETGSIMGTAQYLSPEQAQGLPVSAQSDLYAVGVILWELLTGRVPFDGDTAVTVALKHVTETPPPPSALEPRVPPALDTVVMWALEKDPSRRPPDADAFIAALQDVRARMTDNAVGQETTAFAAPVVPLASETTTVLAPAPVGLVEEEVLVPPPEDPLDPRRRSRWPWLAALLLLLIGGAVAAALLLAPHKAATPQVLLPNVVGKDQATASTILQNAGFQPNVIRQTSRAPKDQVIKEIPPPGQSLDKGSTVTVTVSSGPGQRDVPSVAGLSQSAAQSALRRSGFRAAVGSEASDKVAKGVAISTTPSAGTPLDAGSVVTLTISSGPEQITVHDVTNEQVDTARNDLMGQGLKVSVSEVVSQSKPAGTVLSQSPSGGTMVAKGSSISLSVAKAPEKATVPGVSGMSQSAAIAAIQGAGFTVQTRDKTVSDKKQDGKVLGQSPAAGSQLKKGAHVGIVVGRFKAKPSTNQPGGSTTTPSPPAGGGGTGTGTTPAPTP